MSPRDKFRMQWRAASLTCLILLILPALIFPALSLATPPCPPQPCLNDQFQLDRSACKAAADWIGIGRISDVVHDRVGEPLYRDFAKFTFKVSRWEKNPAGLKQDIELQVNWCNQPLPPSTEGLFRIFGTKPNATNEAQYLFIEPLHMK